MQDPSDAAALARLSIALGPTAAAFRCFSRLVLLADFGIVKMDGILLRNAILATRSVPAEALKAQAATIDFDHPVKVELAVFLAAAFLATRRVDLDALAVRRIRYDTCDDGLLRVLSLLSEHTEPGSPVQAYILSVLKHYVTIVLRVAGFPDAARRMADDAVTFQRGMRRRFNPDGSRIFSWRWTFAIGHMVVTAFLVKGQAAGLLDAGLLDAGPLDAGPAKVWDGRMANPALRSRLLELSDSVVPVPQDTMYADPFDTQYREIVDGRPVDLFDACGIIADRTGDARGAIMRRPAPDDPALTRFYGETGLTPEDPIVTLHGREGGFRTDLHQSLRNVDIRACLPAIRALVARGYRVVRLGDPSMSPLPPLTGVVDYALSPLKTPELDILLPAAAAFHIGSSSGLSKVPLLFGTPTLFLNWYPCEMLPWGRANWTVLRPIVRREDGTRVADWRRYARLGSLHSRLLLRQTGHDVGDLTGEEIERIVLDFAATLAPTPPAPTGVNRGRILLPGDGALVEISPDATPSRG